MHSRGSVRHVPHLGSYTARIIGVDDMADGWCTDSGEAVYRSHDAVKNLKIR